MYPIGNSSMMKRWIVENVDIPTLRRCFLAGEPIAAGTGVYLDTDGKVYTYDTAHDRQYIGIAQDSVYKNKSVTITLRGFIRVPDSGWSAGIVYYMDGSGNLTTTNTGKQVAIGTNTDAILVLDAAGIASLPIAYEIEQFVVDDPGDPPAGVSVYTINQPNVIANSLSVSLDGTVLPLNRVDRRSYTVVYSALSTVITFNQVFASGELYLIQYAKSLV